VDARRGESLASVGDGSGHLCQVELQVPDVSKELVLVDIPLPSGLRVRIFPFSQTIDNEVGSSPRCVRVCVNESWALEIITSFDDSSVSRVTNKLRVVEPSK